MLQSQFYNQLYFYTSNYHFSYDSDMDQYNNTTVTLIYEYTRTLLSNLEKNMDMFDAAQAFYTAIDWTNISTVMV